MALDRGKLPALPSGAVALAAVPRSVSRGAHPGARDAGADRRLHQHRGPVMTGWRDEITAEGAACTLYRDAPAWEGRRTAAIGGFSCASAAAGAALLRRAGEMARAEGFERLIGPMDGDTWH